MNFQVTFVSNGLTSSTAVQPFCIQSVKKQVFLILLALGCMLTISTVSDRLIDEDFGILCLTYRLQVSVVS